MRNAVRELVQQLQNPETASSFVPLTVVVGVFLLASAGSLYFFFRALRVPDGEPGAAPNRKRFFVDYWVSIFGAEGRFRSLWGLMWEPENTRIKKLRAQIHELRTKNSRLKSENAELRQANASSLRQVAELTENFNELNRKSEADRSALDQANAQREKVQARADELEGKVREVMKEIESLYQQNSKALDAANERREKAQRRADEVELHLSEFVGELEKLYRGGTDLTVLQALSRRMVSYVPTPNQIPFDAGWQNEKAALLKSHAEEVKKLKDLLQVCRQQILAFTRRAAEDRKKSA